LVSASLFFPAARVIGIAFLACFGVLVVGLPTSAAMFAPGNLIVKVGSGGVVEFDGSTGTLLGNFTADQPNDMVFYGDYLYATDPSDAIKVYDSLTGELLNTLADSGSLMNPGTIQISPQGEIVVLNRISGNITLDVFDLAGNPLGTLATGAFNDFVFGENGNIFATTAFDAIIELNGMTGLLVGTLATGLSNPNSLAFLPDGTLLVGDGSGMLQYSGTGTFLGLFNAAIPNDFVVGPDGNLYTTDPSDSVLAYDSVTGALQGTFAVTPLNPSALAFRPIPEPSTASLVALGLVGIAAARRRRAA
jgi:sugar lactone lactonase YvrE